MKKFKFNFGTLYTVLMIISLLMALGVLILRTIAVVGAMGMLSTNLYIDISLISFSSLVSVFIILTLTTSKYKFENSSLVMRLALVSVRYKYRMICRLILNLSDNKLWMYFTSPEGEPSCINIRIAKENISEFVTCLRKHNPSIVYLEVDPSREDV